jgi:hypothetical protein
MPYGPREAVSRDLLLDRAWRYISTIPGAVSRQNGSGVTSNVARILIVAFGLSREDAATLLRQWNHTCKPPWSEQELQRKLDWAEKLPGPRGDLAARTFRSTVDEEIAELDGTEFTVTARARPTLVAATGDVAPAATADCPAQAAGHDGTALMEKAPASPPPPDPRDSDPWAKPLYCPTPRQIMLQARAGSMMKTMPCGCHQRGKCFACMHNAKRQKILGYRELEQDLPGVHGITTWHVFRVLRPFEPGKDWFNKTVGRYLGGPHIQVVSGVYSIVFSSVPPPSRFGPAEQLDLAAARARYEAAVAASTGKGRFVTMSRALTFPQPEDTRTGAYKNCGYLDPARTGKQLEAIARANGVRMERAAVPERLQRRFLPGMQYIFQFPADYTDADRQDFCDQLRDGCPSAQVRFGDLWPPICRNRQHGVATDCTSSAFAVDV